MRHVFLVHELNGAGFARQILIFRLRELRDDDDTRTRIELVDGLRCLEAAHAGHAHVHDDPVGMLGCRNLQRFLAGTGFEKRRIQSFKQLFHGSAKRRMIVHNEKLDRWRLRHEARMESWPRGDNRMEHADRPTSEYVGGNWTCRSSRGPLPEWISVQVWP